MFLMPKDATELTITIDRQNESTFCLNIQVNNLGDDPWYKEILAYHLTKEYHLDSI